MRSLCDIPRPGSGAPIPALPKANELLIAYITGKKVVTKISNVALAMISDKVQTLCPDLESPTSDQILGLELMAVALAPPPPRRGFAIRPKLNGDEMAAFWAVDKTKNCQKGPSHRRTFPIIVPRAWSRRSLTACNCASNFWF